MKNLKMKFILNVQRRHLNFVEKKKEFFFSKKFFFVKEHRNRLNELIIKTKDLKTNLYDECLSKDLSKIFFDKIDQMIVS